jgi:hypothetical protein
MVEKIQASLEAINLQPSDADLCIKMEDGAIDDNFFGTQAAPRQL